MTVFKPESVSEQPIIKMSHWSIRKVCDEDAFVTKHLVGLVNGFGRVSSPIEEVMENGDVKTSSGRIYKLIGPVGRHMDSEWMWSVWLEANQVWEVVP